MDIQTFIQSGLLEAYALNQCSPKERAEVERMAATHPEVRTELETIERTLEQVAMANAVSPPPALKEHILQSLKNKPTEPTTPPGSRFLPVLLWAALTLMAATMVWQFVQKSKMEQQVAVLEKQLVDCNSRTEQQTRTQEIVALLRDSGTRAIQLSVAAPDTETTATATVWHNPARAQTVLDINSLPTPENGKYFQFWAIVDGKPVSMGMVTLNNADTWQTLPFIQNAQAFAISAEDNPNGNATPTVVVLVGKV